ncbi:unnamed protein product [Prunus armeniaca]
MSQGNMARHGGAGGDTKRTRVPEATQSSHVARQCGQARRCRRQHKAGMSQGDVTRHEGAGGNTKLACRKAMWLGTWVLKTSLALVNGWVPKA